MLDISASREMTTNDQYVIYPSRWRLILLALGALVFVGLGLVLGGIGTDEQLEGFLLVITTYIGVPFFSLCFAYLVYRLIVRQPALIVNQNGIYDNASGLSAGWIRWDEVERLQIILFGSQEMIGVAVHNEEAVLNRQRWIKRFLMSRNRDLTGYIINIPMTSIPSSAEDLIEQMEHYRELA